MDDARVGLVIRALRRRRGWRQRDLADAAGVNQSDISEMERGHVGSYRVEVVRRVLAALDARCDLEPRWRGSALDRLLDERHAALASQGSGLLGTYGWNVLVEVTYSEYGERGSIDLFAARVDVGAVSVNEVKSEFVSAEATLRALDVKARLAPKLAVDHFGFRPQVVARFLILPDNSTSRRKIALAGPLLDGAFRLRGRDARRWLADPVRLAAGGRLGGVLFLPEIAPIDRKLVSVGRERVRPRQPVSGIAGGDR